MSLQLKGIKLRVAESVPLGLLHANKPVSNRVDPLVIRSQGNPQRLSLYKFIYKFESGLKLQFSQFYCQLLLYKCKEGALMFQRPVVEILLLDQGNLGGFLFFPYFLLFLLKIGHSHLFKATFSNRS